MNLSTDPHIVHVSKLVYQLFIHGQVSNHKRKEKLILPLSWKQETHTHTHTHIYIYIYMMRAEEQNDLNDVLRIQKRVSVVRKNRFPEFYRISDTLAFTRGLTVILAFTCGQAYILTFTWCSTDIMAFTQRQTYNHDFTCGQTYILTFPRVNQISWFLHGSNIYMFTFAWGQKDMLVYVWGQTDTLAFVSS